MSLNTECEFKKEYLLSSTILYVEPNDSIRSDTYDIFSCVFKNVIIANSAHKAIEIFEKQHKSIDVILTDITFSDMDGVEFLSKIRTINWNMPLLITTVFDDPKLLLKLIKFNITNYIVKPIQIRTTFKIISQLMEEEQMKKELKRQEYELKQFMSIIDSINLVCEIDLDGHIIAANDLLLMTSGYSLDEMLEKKHSQFFEEYDNETEESIFRQLLKGKVWSGDCKKVSKEGEAYHTFSIILPIFDNNGKVKKYVECATPTTKYKSEILNLKKQIVSIKSNSFKAIMENKQSQSIQVELTKKYQERVDDSVNNEQQLIMEIHEANKKIIALEEKLKSQAVRFEDFQAFHYEKVQEIVSKYQKRDI